MAMLLAMYQKMRLIREKNQATYDLTKFSSKYDRVSKNIERVQKMYTSKIAKLESQAKLMMSSAKSIFQQTSGLAVAGNSAYLNPYQSGASNAFTSQMLQSILSNGISGYEYDDGKGIVPGNKDSKFEFNSKNSQLLYQLYLQGKLQYSTKNGETEASEGNVFVPSLDGSDPIEISKEEYAMFNTAVQMAQNEYYTRTQWLNQANSNYETNVSIWLDAAKAQLEEEQDEALEPLAYQQTMWELEKEQCEQRLERIKADLESYTRLCSEEAKEQAPKFGLG